MSWSTEVSTLYRAHSAAYELLRCIMPQLNDDTSPVPSTTIEDVTDPARIGDWLRQYGALLPAGVIPDRDDELMVARLMASMLETSFEIVEERNPITDATMRRTLRRRQPGKVHEARMRTVAAQAIRHLCARSEISVTLDAARALVARTATRDDALVVAYTWELRQRARGMSKGSVDHRIWSAISRERRTSLCESSFWLAYDHLRNVIASADSE